MIAIRTSLLYEDLHQQWTPHCEEESRIAVWRPHKSICKIRGTYQGNKDTYDKQDWYRSYLSVRNQSWRKKCSSRNRKSKESCTMIIKVNGSLTKTDEATFCVKDLDIINTVQLLEDSPAVLSLGKLCEEGTQSTTWTKCDKIINFKSENCTDGRIWSYCLEAIQMQHRQPDDRQLRSPPHIPARFSNKSWGKNHARSHASI